MVEVEPLEHPAHEARWWHTGADGRIVCTLCPRLCRIAPGQAGFCYIRQNHGGRLYNLGTGRPSGFAVDPVEKKPLYHFLPGSSILSFGTVGCNLGCRFCQNWDISKAREDSRLIPETTPAQVVAIARRENCQSIAFTYNDPVIFAEFAIDVAREAQKEGIRCVAVTAGYITAEARGEFYEHLAAANVDLKGFTEDFYQRLTLSHLGPVLETLKWLRRETNVWVEITNLIIPGWNDDPAETRRLCEWIGTELGPDVPLHLSAFHPDFKLMAAPPTPPATLRRARRIAQEVGLHYVYTGNVRDPEGAATYCPSCQEPVIERDGYRLARANLQDGACGACGAKIAGLWGGGPIACNPGRPRALWRL